MKSLRRSKTVAFNIAIIGIAYWFRSSTFYVDPMWFVWVIAGVNIGLRLVTSQRLTFR